ncbi:MAG: right-handed parallel beta-helix repeat-containing protein [Planctomycetota bacterium]|jgi:parallel beta-helix repeat protein
MLEATTTNAVRIAVAAKRAALVALLMCGSAGARTLAVPEDYNSIQAAIGDAHAGDTVLVNPGVYDEPVTFKNGIRLVGTDVNEVRITGVEEYAVILVKDCNQGLITGFTIEPNIETDTLTRPLSGIKIANSKIEIEHCIVRNVFGSGIYSMGESVVKVRRCVLESNAHMGIRLGAGVSVTASNNILRDNGEAGLSAKGTKSRLLIEGNRVLRNKTFGFNLSGVKDATVTGNICEGNGAGIGLHGQGLVENNICEGNAWNGILVFSEGVIVRGNRCEYNLHSGIEVRASSRNVSGESNNATVGDGADKNQGILLEGNRCIGNSIHGILGVKSPQIVAKENVCRHNGKDGIQFGRVESVTMESNVSEENKREGIFVFASNVKTTANRNRTLNNNGNGIDFSESSNVDVRGNESRGNGITGIYIHQSTAVTVKGNTCSDNDLYGIQLTEGTGLVAEGNLCQRNDWPGILVEGKGAAATLIGNRCLENNHSGIVFNRGAAGRAEGNVCEHNPWSGIAVRGKDTNPTLTANKCSNNGAWGIISWSGAEPTIEGDNVTLNNGREGIKRRD